MRGNNAGEEKATVEIIEKLAAARQAMKRNIPKALASLTGGEYKPFTSRRGFDADMTSFSNHLESRYPLSFAPREPHPGLHSIEND